MTHWLIGIGAILVVGCGGTAGVMMARNATAYPGENDAERAAAKRVNTRRAVTIVWVVVLVIGVAATLGL